MAVGLIVAAFGLASLDGTPFLVVLGIYFLLTLSYSFSLKAIVLVDTIVLAGLYTMRVIAGYAATDIVPTFWLLAFALFLFFGLAMLKRFSELIALHPHIQYSSRFRTRGSACCPPVRIPHSTTHPAPLHYSRTSCRLPWRPKLAHSVTLGA